MGANLAAEIAGEKFSEATVGYSNAAHKSLFVPLFHRDYFHVSSIQDTEGVEMCGTLKNIVALGAGFVDGLQMGIHSTRFDVSRCEVVGVIWCMLCICVCRQQHEECNSAYRSVGDDEAEQAHLPVH